MKTLMDTMNDRRRALQRLVELATTPGNFDHDEYQFGYANGLILAFATMNGTEPKFLPKPEVWGKDLPK